MLLKNDILLDFFNYGILVYGIVLVAFYIILSFISALEISYYLKRNSFVNYNEILASPLAPSISVIAPVYNESLTIVQNIRSLLSLHYVNHEILVINDGSTDDSLKKIIETYALIKVNYAIDEQLSTQKVRGIYKSTNSSFNRLTVIDKENGGKADALNLGLNISKNDLVVCIDADCILEQDALLKMVKPFLESEKEKVIAAGGVVRVANSCIIKDGKLVEVKIPEKYLAKYQTLEYIRSFLLGRMAWSRLNGLLIVSGALGLFDRKIVIASGGYGNTVGEDMELVVRIRKYMHNKREKYKVAYIPDPLCWTEVPETYRILGRQRNRWARGMIETLLTHKKLFINPYYGKMGVVSHPYWVFYEWLAPIIEFFGILYFITLAFFGLVNWAFFLPLLMAIYLFAVMYSMFSILSEELTYHQYPKKNALFKLSIIALLEPVFFHFYVIWFTIKGNFDFLFGKKKYWGEMVRTGFKK